VRRALPSLKRKLVGPFIFFDRMGPATFKPGEAIDVRPHPHIGLSTVTYLYDGTIRHRDSLGTEMVIAPGDINLMTAGRGIVHSERSPEETARPSRRMSGLQTWLALPDDKEEIAPAFENTAAAQHGRPRRRQGAGARADRLLPRRVLAGVAIFRHALCRRDAAGRRRDRDPRRGGRTRDLCRRRLDRDRRRHVRAGPVAGVPPRRPDRGEVRTRRVLCMLFGGASLGSRRYIWWNFVSSSRERIEQAKEEWKSRRFDIVPGDEEEFIPLPER
jgi:redox-sensitive bicupin YhaK (pirin superfamily)